MRRVSGDAERPKIQYRRCNVASRKIDTATEREQCINDFHLSVRLYLAPFRAGKGNYLVTHCFHCACAFVQPRSMLLAFVSMSPTLLWWERLIFNTSPIRIFFVVYNFSPETCHCNRVCLCMELNYAQLCSFITNIISSKTPTCVNKEYRQCNKKLASNRAFPQRRQHPASRSRTWMRQQN